MRILPLALVLGSLALTQCATPVDEPEGEVASELVTGKSGGFAFPSPTIVREGSTYHAWIAKHSFGGKVYNVAHATREADDKAWKLEGDALPKLGARAVHTGGYAVWAPAVAKINANHWAEALVARAVALDPTGDYRVGIAERLDFEDQCFDLVVSYLSLIDIAQLSTALTEMARVLRPGGSVLVANLTGFTTAGMVFGGRRPRGADKHAGYLDEHSSQVSWGDIRIRNWHRPLETYMTGFLDAGLELRHFSEPRPQGGPPEKVRRYLKAPYFLIMEWTKPEC